MARKKSKKNNYFGQDVEDAIIEYNQFDTWEDKHNVYAKRIDKPLRKLIEYLINHHQIYHIAHTYDETVSLGVEYATKQMHHYKKEKGKAFSYFQIILRNYYFGENTKAWKRKTLVENVSRINCNIVNKDKSQSDIKYDFFYELIAYLKENYMIIFTEKEYTIMESIIILLEKSNNIEIFNKKAITFNLREMSGCTQQQLTKVLRLLKSLFRKLYTYYDDNGYLNYKYIPKIETT